MKEVAEEDHKASGGVSAAVFDKAGFKSERVWLSGFRLEGLEV